MRTTATFRTYPRVLSGLFRSVQWLPVSIFLAGVSTFRVSLLDEQPLCFHTTFLLHGLFEIASLTPMPAVSSRLDFPLTAYRRKFRLFSYWSFRTSSLAFFADWLLFLWDDFSHFPIRCPTVFAAGRPD